MGCLRYMALCLLPLLVVPTSLASSLCRTDPNRIKFFAALVFSSVLLFPSIFCAWLAVSAGLLLALCAFQSDMKAGARLRCCCRNAALLYLSFFFRFFFWACDLIFLIKFFATPLPRLFPILRLPPMMIMGVGMMCVFYKSNVVGSVADLRPLIG